MVNSITADGAAAVQGQSVGCSPGVALFHWILGQNTANRTTRWSIIRDVLRWVE